MLAAHAQKGLPAFGIYGKDVLDTDDTSIPEDVKTKLLRFGWVAVAVASIRGRSYLQIGSGCMGLQDLLSMLTFFEEYLGMRVESVDKVEILRCMDEEIYDKEEFEKALVWAKENCKIGFDKNDPTLQRTEAEKGKEFEFCVRMMCIIKDLFAGNSNLPEERREERLGHNAIAGGFQGQRQWTDHWPNGDFFKALLSSSFDWEGAREPYILATENDNLNGVYKFGY